MARNFWKIVNEVIRNSDIIVEVLDARFPKISRNEEIENKIKKNGKKIIYVLNKTDLAKRVNKIEVSPLILISSTKRQGLRELRTRIQIEAKRLKKENVTVGVLGYPNTGKSSLINALKGRKAAPTSSISGFTKALMKVRITRGILMIDTPGVFPFSEDDEVKNTLLGAKNPSNIEFPEDAAEVIIDSFSDEISEYYNCSADLESLAERLGKKKKGGELDLKATSVKLLHDWQNGKIK